MSERQTPQVVKEPENMIETPEPKEAHRRLYTQEINAVLDWLLPVVT